MRPTLPPGRGRYGPTWRRITTAVVVLATLTATASCTDDDSPGGSRNGKLDGTAIAAAGKGLPADPARAAEQLVTVVHGENEGAARAATAELLRRSGFLIVSADGPVVARPDHLVLRDALVYTELIPALTRATRQGYGYRVGQLSALLQELGATDKPATFAQVTGEIATLGKRPGADPAFVSAGAAVRALSARRGEVLFAGADQPTTTLDPLQVALLTGHALSRFALVKPGTGGAKPQGLGGWDRLLGSGVAYAEETGVCHKMAELTQDVTATQDLGKTVTEDMFMRQLTKKLGDRVGGAVETANDRWDKLSTVVSSVMLLLGARIDLISDKPKTHFKHKPNTGDEHVMLTATASWDLDVAASKLECYALAGVETPPKGPLEGYRVWWTDRQPGSAADNGAKYLGVARRDNEKLFKGSLTDGAGKTTLELKPLVENPAGKGRELTGSARFIASLEKEDFPISLSDLYSIATGGAVGKAFDVIVELVTKFLMPSKSVDIEVSYHGSDIVIARGAGTVDIPFYATIPNVHVDLVSCDGLRGPYKGTAGHGPIEVDGTFQSGSGLFGVHVPAKLPATDTKLELSVPDLPGTVKATAAKGTDGTDLFTVKLDVESERYGSNRHEVVRRGLIGRPVGEVEILVDSHSWVFGPLDWPVYRVPRDPRCDATEFYFDQA